MKIVLCFVAVLWTSVCSGQPYGFDAYATVARSDSGAWTSGMAFIDCKDVVVLWPDLMIEVLGENGEREVYTIDKGTGLITKSEGRQEISYDVKDSSGVRHRAELTFSKGQLELALRHEKFSVVYKLRSR